MDIARDPKQLAVGVHVDAPAESLLFTEYRCWMAGYDTRDVTCWELAWIALTAALPLDAARALYGEFHHFVRSIREFARREVGWRPAACRSLCRDERLVLALVEASQRRSPLEEITFASCLLGRDESQSLISASRSLGLALAKSGFVLCPLQQIARRPTMEPARSSSSLH